MDSVTHNNKSTDLNRTLVLFGWVTLAIACSLVLGFLLYYIVTSFIAYYNSLVEQSLPTNIPDVGTADQTQTVPRYSPIAIENFNFEVGEECAICLEEFSHSRLPLASLECGHLFHFSCITRWHSSCPLCRR
ncbi:unnamed protein product [Arabidopsis lyrata]|uniref:RING-type domain-containing protein n=1 Tax=Arabidopsis lyrata subsp. lyrata TaxID=81972 RepID=D7LLH8_ARALL|nr:hypothetical protein ARALYDRAFT_903044 [Arabidopsis lyrata subsp. lyrata]EFH57843.1 hypothetical protein ARALYDRAFT_903047 [Arabidopsis lyrata subsp. lyrata]CAH8265163.1 unnamed protein product [Arabidopsis lyrata]CAH8265166.1 unnamed protein product [Arabidopsis lyrata]